MVELSLMASRGYPPGLGVVFHPEQGSNRGSVEFDHALPYHGSNQDLINPLAFNLSLQQKREWRTTGRLLGYNHFIKNHSISKCPGFVDFQETHPDLVLFSSGIVEQCVKHEKIMKLLASGSIDEQGGLLDLSVLYDLMGPQLPDANLPQQPFASSSRCCFNDPQSLQDLVYPTRELYFNEPSLDLLGDWSSCPENVYHPHGQLKRSCTGAEMNEMLSVISNFYSSKNTNKSSKQTMLVPYFERRRRARTKTDASKLATEKVESLKSPNKVKEKTSPKKKTGTKTVKERDIYCNSYLHACESLLSIIVDRKQQGKIAIISLKKSSPQLPQLLTQFSASIAGTGIAVLLSVFCRVACSRVPFCASKLLTSGLGLGLVWLSWAVNKLRDTVISISRTSGSGEEEENLNRLDRNLRDIYLRAAALVAVAVLKVA